MASSWETTTRFPSEKMEDESAWGRLSAAIQWLTSLLSQRSNYISRASSWALSCPLPLQRLLGYSMRYTVHDGPLLRAREAYGDVRAGSLANSAAAMAA